MEQAQYWMCMKKRQILKSDFQVWRSSINDSWEEKAFAEDASGDLGGCIWPPRSYSCSFCKREFRSAQALGGHMNVHRRDRARLKQFDLISPENQTQSLDSNFPIEVSTLGNCDFHPNSSAGSRVSGFLVQENSSGHTNFASSHPPSEPDQVVVIKNPIVETDLLIGFNSAGDNSCKRAKKTGVSSFSLLIKQPCLGDRYSFKPEISTEDIDLELRLGQ